MKRISLFVVLAFVACGALMAQDAENNVAVEQQDSTAIAKPVVEVSVWKKKLYYGYNFDIYFHHDSKANTKENGWSISVTPELGWRLKERVYLGMRVGGSYQDAYMTESYEALDGTIQEHQLRVMMGSWDVTPYMRYRMKTLFNDKVGIWLEAHLYTGMEFPKVMKGDASGTTYDNLKYAVNYGVQVSPVITYQFNKKSTFQVFFSIMSFGYSGTARFYDNNGKAPSREYTNDIIIFSGKLRNLIANQFTPGLYGLKFGVMKSF